MRARAVQMAIAILFACGANGQIPSDQAVDRVFHFANADTAQDCQQIAMVVRSMTDIRDESIDAAQKALAVRGTAGQIAMAEWLVNELDNAASRKAAQGAAHEYRVSPNADDVMRVFYLAHAQTVQELQEVATNLRSMTEVRRLFTYNAAKAIALRGTAGQAAMAEWLVAALDKPRPAAGQERQASATDEFRVSAGGDDLARVFYLAHAETTQDLQEVAVLLRSLGDIPRVFVSNAPKAIVMRGTPVQVAMADWLVKELDQAANRQTASVPHEYRMSPGADDLVRVFYLAHAGTVQEVQETARQVRITTGVKRIFTYNAVKALALRGTVDQVTLAERLIKERDGR